MTNPKPLISQRTDRRRFCGDKTASRPATALNLVVYICLLRHQGDGPVSGQEVVFSVTFTSPITLGSPGRPAPATGPGTATPESEKAALKVGGVAPPTMSVPTRSQSGCKASSRTQV